MKRAAFAAALAVSAGGCGRDPQPPAKPPLASSCEAVMFEDSPLTHCIADPAKDTIRTALGGPDGAPLRSLPALKASLAQPDAVAFALNGGMFDDGGQPIGYFVEHGERRHILNRKHGAGNFHLLPNGVFYGTAGAWAVRTADAFADQVTRRPEFATQSGPMLVIDGKLHPAFAEDGDSLKIRNAVGVDRRGRAHFVISEVPVSFGKLARYYRDVLETPNALFLDGSVSQLWDPGHQRLDDTVPLGPLIVVEKRATGAP